MNECASCTGETRIACLQNADHAQQIGADAYVQQVEIIAQDIDNGIARLNDLNKIKITDAPSKQYEIGCKLTALQLSRKIMSHAQAGSMLKRIELSGPES